MFNKLKIKIKFYINNHAKLKTGLIEVLEYYYDFRKVFLGLLTRFPSYIINLYNTTVIARPGTCGYKGGVFNPGAFVIGSNIVLLAKGQDIQWWRAKGKYKELYLIGGPVVFILDKISSKRVSSSRITQLVNFPANDSWRIADTRLFKWREKILINHSMTYVKDDNGSRGQDYVRSALSEYDHKNSVLRHICIPEVDFELNKFEKNWVYFSKDDRLFILYSLNPYRLLELVDGNEYKFKTIKLELLRNDLDDPGRLGTYVSLSTNPIDYNDDHWFMLVHQISHKFTGRCYYHWGVWINKTTLFPEYITSRHIFSGMGARGRTPGIRYISSILKCDNKIIFFAGEGDVYITSTKLKINQLDQLKRPLAVVEYAI